MRLRKLQQFPFMETKLISQLHLPLLAIFLEPMYTREILRDSMFAKDLMTSLVLLEKALLLLFFGWTNKTSFPAFVPL